MMLAISIILGALFFAGAAYLGITLGEVFAERLQPLEGGPPSHGVPVLAIAGVSAAIGAILFWLHVPVSQIMMIGIVCISLAAIFVTDARRGIVPDVFSLGPLAIILLVGLWQHEWNLFLAAGVPFAPFAFAAMRSKGRGMGWGDAKLVALGGAVLGMELGIVACIVACVAAVAVNYSRGKRRGVFAFAPYLTACFALAIPFGVLLTAR